MPAPVPLPIRQAIQRRSERGATTSELSQAFGIPARTVRNLLRRFRACGAEGLTPDYRRLPQPPPAPEHPAFSPAARLREAHAGWGAGLIRIYLEIQGVRPLPCVRTLQKWFRRVGLGPAPPGRRPVAARRATTPHQVWEIDAAEEIPLGDGARVSWLRIVDEFTGAVLHTAVFPPRALEQCAGAGDADRTPPRVLPLGTAPGRPRR